MLEVVLVVSAALGLVGSTGLLARSARHSIVEIDDGGIRHGLGASRAYISFADLEDATLDRSLGGATRLVLRSAGSKARTWRLRIDDATPSGLLAEVLRGMAFARREVPALARRGRPLDAWLADVDALASEDTTYRSSPLARADLVTIFLDRTAAVEARAAAGYAVLVHGDAREASVVLGALGSSLPPLVIAALARAPGAAVVLGELIADVTPFLSTEDHEAVARFVNAPVAPESRARIDEAMRVAASDPAATTPLVRATPSKLRRSPRPRTVFDLLIGRTLFR